MLFADPHIGSAIDRWRALRTNSIMDAIAQKRADHLKSLPLSRHVRPTVYGILDVY